MTKQKIWYNVNANDTRLEQFETLKQAQAYINKQLKLCITKSTYEYDEECGCWEEIKEQFVTKQK